MAHGDSAMGNDTLLNRAMSVIPAKIPAAEIYSVRSYMFDIGYERAHSD